MITNRQCENIAHNLHYETRKGEHTFHMCDCGVNGCRGQKCVDCWIAELRKGGRK